VVDKDVFVARLNRLDELLRHLDRLHDVGHDEYFRSVTNQASAERWLQLAAECSLGLASHAISDRALRVPASYRDSFDVLREAGLIDSDLALAMKGWAGLRNVLVHIYLTIDHEILWQVIEKELPVIRRFADSMARLL
jgi:uncharacterized protein YutE (UPF0331/DUF86 family)